MPQRQLPLFPKGSTEINNHLAVLQKDGKIFYFYGSLPIFDHHVDDDATFRMITSSLYVNGNATQKEICRAFSVSPSSVKRSVRLYREQGSAGFYVKRRSRGAAVLTPSVLEDAQLLFDSGLSISEVSEKLDIKYDTLQKAVRFDRLNVKKK